MFPRNENRNEGTFGHSPGMKTGTRVRSHVAPEQNTGTRARLPKLPFGKPPFKFGNPRKMSQRHTFFTPKTFTRISSINHNSFHSDGCSPCQASDLMSSALQIFWCDFRTGSKHIKERTRIKWKILRPQLVKEVRRFIGQKRPKVG